jgi:hypothetical protein
MKYEANKILDPQWYPMYKQQIDALYSQAIELNSYLFVLEKVMTFPFWLFAENETTFWTLTINSFFQAAVMCSWRVAVDSDSDFLTLRKFKNDLIQHVVDPKAEAILRAELKKIHFDLKLKTVGDKISKLRHRMFAHFHPSFLMTAQGKTPTTLPWTTLGDIQIVRDAVNELIQILGFNVGYRFLPISYDPVVKHPRNVDSRPDIVRLLDDLAHGSSIMHMPEREPIVWPHRRKLMSEDEVNLYNEYRKRFRLPEVP